MPSFEGVMARGKIAQTDAHNLHQGESPYDFEIP